MAGRGAEPERRGGVAACPGPADRGPAQAPRREPEGRARGYATQAERFAGQRRLQALRVRLAQAEARLAAGHVSVCRGGRRLARARHNLQAAAMSPAQWRRAWDAERWLISADGEAGKRLGNETIRWHPGERWLEVNLPGPLAHLANAPHGRYRLSCEVDFPYRGGQVAAQAETGAVAYAITFDPGKDRWYLDASWRVSPGPPPAPPTPAIRTHELTVPPQLPNAR